ncbi:MAG: DUF1906 domain-containing protein [Actinomycetales bacterium]|nr:DUF1906 domain-containing protein [Candidatus Lutibacillus vidarii]
MTRRTSWPASGLAANAGHPVYYDMEGYDITNSGCVLAVKTFVNAWTVRLHARGYVSGVYGSAGSLMTNLVQWSADSSFHLPDGIWNAHWDGRNTTVGDPTSPTRSGPIGGSTSTGETTPRATAG